MGEGGGAERMGGTERKENGAKGCGRGGKRGNKEEDRRVGEMKRTGQQNTIKRANTNRGATPNTLRNR